MNSLKTGVTFSINWAGPRRGRILHVPRHKIPNLGVDERKHVGVSVFTYSS